MSDTAAPLVPYEVKYACKKALDDIAAARAKIRRDILTSKGVVVEPGKMIPIDVWGDLPDHERMIPEMHRVDDEVRLKLIHELAEQLDQMPALFLQVSLEDFQLIKKWYKK